jgi:hypothetical protein
MYPDNTKTEIVNLYLTSAPKTNTSLPFMHTVELDGPRGQVVRLRSVFDDGAMINAIDLHVMHLVYTRLSPLRPSKVLMRMADGRIIPSQGVWEGTVRVEGVAHRGRFEVFDSGGAWALLFGKPLLEAFKAVHHYEADIIELPRGETSITVTNQYMAVGGVAAHLLAGLTIDIKQRTTFLGDRASPSRQVLTSSPPLRYVQYNNVVEPTVSPLRPTGNSPAVESNVHSDDRRYPDWATIWTLTGADRPSGEPHLDGVEQPDMARTFDKAVLTRKTNPFKVDRVAAVLAEITIGDDLTSGERNKVVDLLREYADCFALSMGEVLVVKGAAHRLNIPNRETATFRTKVNQRPMSVPQKEYFNGVLDKMLAADIIEPIGHRDVKCCGATTLAKKAHEGGGLSINELQRKVNEECAAAHFPTPFMEAEPPTAELPASATHPPASPAETPAKWRVCQDFADLNKVTKVRPMPQGDIRAKQQRLSGHRWVSIFDFASGFYACEIWKEDRPYICFYVEGRGYFAYKKMPFGLTGAPSTFGELTANTLGDLVGVLIELFVDDGGVAGNIFEDKMATLRILLQRVRDTKLSLSASKSKFFMTEAVFAGARVGPEGIKPDLAKLTAVVNWKTPADLQNLVAFNGLTGYFRPLIKGYAALAQPLTDLAREAQIPKGWGKSAYRRAMKAFTLQDLWTDKHQRAFLDLKIALTSEPVLKGPKFDGTPFIITTDGCKTGFAGMISQCHTTVDSTGKSVSRIHPVAFASKRTSAVEEKYKPFLMEFAALKFSLDKFDDIIWGFPIELETDCFALRDNLSNTEMNATHERWRDGILAHHIVDVRHRPGRLNRAADGLSRQYATLPIAEGDGHEWSTNQDWESGRGLVNDILQVASLPEYSDLRKRFVNDKLLLEVVNALLDLDHGTSLRARGRARHRALGYMIEGGKLWRVGDGKDMRARPRRECISEVEAYDAAKEAHKNNGHFRRDLIKVALMDKFYSPRLDKSIVRAITECGRCKSFGPTHLHSLLEPITRRHPFELLVTDTLSMPTGKGGFTKISLTMDVYSQHVWATKLKSAPTGKSSCVGFNAIAHGFTAPETLMSDGGAEFNNKEVREACAAKGTQLVIVAAYSPWINGLIEGTNSKILSRLKRACAPDLGEDSWNEMPTVDIPRNWPDHLEEAVTALNNRILPHLGFSPNELLLGLVINTRPTPIAEASLMLGQDDVGLQMAYVDQQRIDGYAAIVDHAVKRKAAFDKDVLHRAPRCILFRAGQLVQVYRSDLDFSFKSERKLEPKWSAPRRVVSRVQNSYRIATLEGLPIAGLFSSRRLRRFLPRSGTILADVQEALGDNLAAEEELADIPGPSLNGGVHSSCL